jgi:hypothetical protein
VFYGKVEYTSLDFDITPVDNRFDACKEDIEVLMRHQGDGASRGYSVHCSKCHARMWLDYNHIDLPQSRFLHDTWSDDECNEDRAIFIDEIRRMPESTFQSKFFVRIREDLFDRKGNVLIDVVDRGVRYSTLREATPEELRAKNQAFLDLKRKEFRSKAR